MLKQIMLKQMKKKQRNNYIYTYSSICSFNFNL